MKPKSLVPSLVASLLALAFLWTASTIAPELAFPPSSLADRIVRLTPGDIATTAIDRFQHNALRLLNVAAGLAFVMLGTLLPNLVPVKKRFVPYVAGGLFAGLVGAVAAFDPVPRPTTASAAAAVAAGALYAAVLARLVLWSGREHVGRSFEGGELSRRRVLELGASIAASFIAGSGLGRVVEWALGGKSVTVAGARKVGVAARRPPFPAIPGLSPEVTSVADHYVVDIDISDPVVDGGSWRLSVGGLVERPLKLSFGELQRRFEVVDEYSVLTCISNKVGGPLVGNSRWTGVRLRDVLARAGIPDGAVDVAFRCTDGYSVAIPIDLARDPNVLLAIAQNGKALTREHGFPCRVRVPALYGMMNAKWVESIEVVDHHFKGYWQKQGWSDIGTVRTESRIDAPSKASVGEPTRIAGVAWAGDRGISAVELSVDGGRTWRRANLHPPITRLAWTQWAYRWTPTRAGRYLVACRAIDGNRMTQDRTRRSPHPSGASGYHEVEIEVA